MASYSWKTLVSFFPRQRLTNNNYVPIYEPNKLGKEKTDVAFLWNPVTALNSDIFHASVKGQTQYLIVLLTHKSAHIYDFKQK